MEKADSDLATYLKKEQHPIKENRIIKMMLQIAFGLEHLHRELQVTHRDLKHKNILVCGYRLKIADFGIAKELDPETNFISSKGDLRYAAPEVF